MKHRLTKAAAAVAIATAAVFAAPAMANAYTPSAPDSGTVTIAPGAPTTIAFTGFAPNERVDFTLTGENASGANLAFVKFAVNSTAIAKAADASGAAPVTLTLPADASGEYTLTAAAASGSVTQIIRVGSAAAGGGDALATTGFDNASLLPVWIAGGTLVLAGSAIAVGATVRRNRQKVSA